MGALLLWLLLIAPPADSTAPADKKMPVSYKTARTLPALEKCLYDELSDLGDATFMRSEGETILMIRNGEAAPVLVDILPPAVTIETRATRELQLRVKRCV